MKNLAILLFFIAFAISAESGASKNKMNRKRIAKADG
jgi:hypothetical protein